MEPLHGIRVADFSRLVAGAGATRILAGYGAQVIRCEWPEGAAADNARDGHWNLDKYSLTLNMKRARGMEVVKRLISISDVFVENYRPSAMKGMGLDYESVRNIQPNIVYLSMSGWGQDGPRRLWGSYGGSSAAHSGMSFLAGLPGRAPAGAPVAYADENPPWLAASAIMMGLHYRNRTGEGLYVDMGQTQAAAALTKHFYLDKSVNGRSARRHDFPPGNAREFPASAPHNVFPCAGADAWCAIAIITDEEWASLKGVMGRPAWANDPRYSSGAGRFAHREDIEPQVATWTKGIERYDLMFKLQANGVPAGVVQNSFDLAEFDQQLAHRNTFMVYHSPTTGMARHKTQAIALSTSPYQPKRAIPTIGQDNRFVLGELLGYSDTEIMALDKEGVIKLRPADRIAASTIAARHAALSSPRKNAVQAQSRSPGQVLDDLLILELGDAGTQATGQLLADMGARVIKIEPPQGAATRHRGPYKDDKPDVNQSLFFWAFNTNKESITLDLENEGDRLKFKHLAAKAAIILEDFRPGYLSGLGIGYPELSQANPGLIMTSITPFGQTGPWKDWKGSDLVYWALGGILAGGGYGGPGSPPLAPQGELSYTTASFWALMGTLLAVLARNATGEGQQVDLSIHEACSYVNRNDITEVKGQFTAQQNPPKREGGERGMLCKDGKYFIAQMTYTRPSQWLQLVEWFKSEGTGQQMWHLDNMPALEKLEKESPGPFSMAPPLPGVMESLREVAARKNAADMMPIGQKMGFTWMVFNSPDELMEDEQLLARGFFQKVHHPELGKTYTYPGEPYKFSKAGWKLRSRPPLLGEHNALVAGLTGL